MHRCTLVDMLHFYGIRFDHLIQTKLNDHLILPGRGSTVDSSDIQQGLNQPLDLEPEMVVMLQKSTTLKVLKQLDLDLQNFLHPIFEHFEFLVYFHLHNCEMFSKYLKSQIDKLFDVNKTVDESGITLAFPNKGKHSPASEPQEQLEKVHIKLLIFS